MNVIVFCKYADHIGNDSRVCDMNTYDVLLLYSV